VPDAHRSDRAADLARSCDPSAFGRLREAASYTTPRGKQDICLTNSYLVWTVSATNKRGGTSVCSESMQFGCLRCPRSRLDTPSLMELEGLSEGGYDRRRRATPLDGMPSLWTVLC
jgi:hypothetical protein